MNSQKIKVWQDQQEMLEERFQQLKHLDSFVFVEISAKTIVSVNDFRRWMLALEYKWMKKFNKNRYYNMDDRFHEESGVGGYFEGVYFASCKLFRHDGTFQAFREDDWRAKRGLQIRDHYSERDVVKVHTIADNLLKFLMQEKVDYTRMNLNRDTKELNKA